MERSQIFQGLISKQSMSKCLFILLIPLAIAGNVTLMQAVQAGGDTGGQAMRALSCIVGAHPELQNYTVLDISDESVGNTTEVDYFVTLSNGNTTIVAAVSFYTNQTNFFVSLNTLPPTPNKPPPPPLPPQFPNPNSHANSSINPEKSPPPPQDNLYPNFPKMPGGYQPLPSLADVKLKIAEDHLLEKHANMVNYKLQNVEYQVVTGINYILFYSGVDQITNLTAKVYVDINGVPYLTAFRVFCANPSQSCNVGIANSIFHGTEKLLALHPELRSYALLSIDLENSLPPSLLFLATFQNQQLRLRAMAQVGVGLGKGKGMEVLSFYSYRYQ